MRAAADSPAFSLFCWRDGVLTGHDALCQDEGRYELEEPHEKDIDRRRANCQRPAERL